MKSYYGNYLGVVITGGDKDPEYRGRTQVFVPNIMPALYDNWNEDGQDITFEVIGQGLDGSLNPKIIDRLKNILPWAECAAPITGASPSYGASVGGFVSEVVRNVGVATDAVKEAAKGAWNTLTGPPPTDQAGTLATLTNQAAADKYANGRCGPAVAESVLQKVYGYSNEEIRAGSSGGRRDGKEFNNILPKLGWTATKINKAEDAPPGAIISYSGTNENPYGHVEAVGQNASGQKTYLFGLGEVSSPGGGTRVSARNMKGFEGICWLPPADRVTSAAAKKGLPNQSPSSLPNPQATTNMQQDPTKEQEAAKTLDGQQKVDLGLQSSPEQMSLGGTQVRNYDFKGKQSEAFAAIKAAAEKAGSPDPNLTASIASLEGGWLTSSMSKRANNPFGQTIKESQIGTNGIIGGTRGRDGQLHAVYDSLESAMSHHVKKWGKNYVPGNVNASTQNLVGANYNIEQGGGPWARDVQGIYAKRSGIPGVQVTGLEGAPPDAAGAIASNQPLIQNPTPHHGVSGPNTNNQALGMFGYASEGQSVWVFFREGNPLFPVYFAASYGNKEWGNMYQNASHAFGSGEPGTLKMQNMFYGGGFNSSMSTDESKMGQGHSFQLFDNNGSNLTFAKDHTQFNAMYNHVSRVMGDNHDISETNKEVRVRGNYNTFTEQDMFITVGNWTDEAIAASDEIQSYINEAMEIKSKTGKS